MAGVIINVLLVDMVLQREKISYNKIELYVVAVSNFISMAAVLVYVYNGAGLLYCNYYMCMMWLSFLAYTDYKSMYVFDVMEYYAIIPIVISIYTIIHNNTMYSAVVKFVMILIIVSALWIGTLCNMYGEGDADALSVICVVCADVGAIIAIFMMALFLFIVRNIKNIQLLKCRLSNPQAFLPSVYMSYIIILCHRIIFL